MVVLFPGHSALCQPELVLPGSAGDRLGETGESTSTPALFSLVTDHLLH